MANEKKKPLLPKSSLIIRLVAGMYLIYLAYELFMGLGAAEGAPVEVSAVMAAVFLIIGLVLVIFSGKDFLKGNYEGGAMDRTLAEECKKEGQDCILEDTFEEK